MAVLLNHTQMGGKPPRKPEMDGRHLCARTCLGRYFVNSTFRKRISSSKAQLPVLDAHAPRL